MRGEVSFDDWTGGRTVPSLGTNDGAAPLAIQRWVRFKEAFAPEVVQRAINESGTEVSSCLDPFAGSGTTALACQFLGVRPVAIELNPYLADLTEAKLAAYETDRIARDLGRVLRGAAKGAPVSAEGFWDFLPATFVEPGNRGRWLFDRAVADRIAGLLHSISEVPDAANRRLFRVLVGASLLDHSNVIVSGKGRRYRRLWEARRRSADAVLPSWAGAVQAAIRDISGFGRRRCLDYEVHRGDARQLTRGIDPMDLAVFSPPYPNTFDYTDVYNVELWMLGYLENMAQNRALRLATLSSHVQVLRDYAEAPLGSPRLDQALVRLTAAGALLWSRWLPHMIGSYFSDLMAVLENLHGVLIPGASAWIIVGDSQYDGIVIETGAILAELAPAFGYDVRLVESFRSMHGSPQQGRNSVLDETLVVLDRRTESPR
jgi:DNA modification methylase